MLFFEILWWMQALRHDYFSYFPSRYLLSITMIFGATVAGMTSEGGGAVAFPVMTLALGIAPSVARDFSLMIQSCGMTAAAFTIFWMRIKLEKHSLIFCSTGAFAGMILGKMGQVWVRSETRSRRHCSLQIVFIMKIKDFRKDYYTIPI